MAEIPLFQQKQYAFAAHIRDPEGKPAPAGIEDRRMEIYRTLFFNNLYGLLGNTFPVIRKIYGADGWGRLIRLFMAHYEAQTPYFLEVPGEFVNFLQGDYPTKEKDHAFLAELAHYEWVELELSVSSETDDLRNISTDGDLMNGVPVKSRLARVCEYAYPVQHISASFLPDTTSAPTYLCVYRRLDDEMGFMELNPVTARLLQLVDDNPDGLSGEAIIRVLAGEMNYPDPDSLIVHGADALRQMKAVDIVLGARAGGA